MNLFSSNLCYSLAVNPTGDVKLLTGSGGLISIYTGCIMNDQQRLHTDTFTCSVEVLSFNDN